VGVLAQRPKCAPKLQRRSENIQVMALFGVVCKTVVAGLLTSFSSCEHVAGTSAAELSRSQARAAPLRCTAGAPVTGLCVGTPARHGRAPAGQVPQIKPAHPGAHRHNMHVPALGVLRRCAAWCDGHRECGSFG
jgi:hypothetical protein